MRHPWQNRLIVIVIHFLSLVTSYYKSNLQGRTSTDAGINNPKHNYGALTIQIRINHTSSRALSYCSPFSNGRPNLSPSLRKVAPEEYSPESVGRHHFRPSPHSPCLSYPLPQNQWLQLVLRITLWVMVHLCLGCYTQLQMESSGVPHISRTPFILVSE